MYAPIRSEILIDVNIFVQELSRAETLVDEWDQALRTRVGKGLRHEGFSLVSTGQLHQHHLVGDLRRRC